MSTVETHLNKTWATRAISWEYGAAASPDLIDVPIEPFPASLHEIDETSIIPLDLSNVIGTPWLATTPSLLAHFIALQSGGSVQLAEKTSSEVFFVMRGAGRLMTDQGTLEWKQGDVFTLPRHDAVVLEADENSALYWVHDGPLLRYLGSEPQQKRFEPAYYSREYLQSEVDRIRQAGIDEQRNRNGIILGNPASSDTKTITHTMWSLFNVLPARSVQKPHRHNSVAVDLAVSAAPGTYTMIGKEIDAKGNIINPVRADWNPNSVFVTPPGWWHSHHNESDEDAYVFPVQDAGLQTFLRTLDIQFVS